MVKNIILKNNYMIFKSILKQLNVFAKCRELGASIWQCPQFLFLIMGVTIIGSSLIFYLIGTGYYAFDPLMVAMSVLAVAFILFIIFFMVIHNFERLIEVSRMKSEFVDITSHQIRSPLTSLKWIIELLASGKTKLLAKERKKYLDDAQDNIKLMVELIDDLLVVTKIENKNFSLRKKEISFKKMIEDSISQFKFFSDASKIKLKFHCKNDLPKMFIDGYYLKLAIDNLIGNAIRYTPGKGSIDIYLVKEGKSFLFKVQDNGVGIPQKDQKYIFQKFFRSENLLKEEVQGSGLGLYITRLAIKRLKGKIWFESKEEKGTTFYFTIPIQ